MAAVLSEIDGEAIAGNDDGILFQPPAGNFLLTRKELQAGRIDGGEADLRLTRRGRRTHRVGATAIACDEGGGDQERDSDCRRATVTRTPAPVAPRDSRGVSCSAYAVPAMSRCAHDGQSTNSLRNSAAVTAPPHRPPEFFMSAHSLRIRSLYSSHSGNLQRRSPTRSPHSINFRASSSSLENRPAASLASATTQAPVSVAKSSR